tara:strand:+ start:102 stop:761 length:660 start_codon:yes stop_codon:yes gene_type:complete
MKLVFIGAPASGKGTYAKGVAPILNIPHVSSGEAMRQARSNPKFGKEIEKYQSAGLPVPDEIAVDMIKARLTQDDCKNGFLFDTPYNANQAELLDQDPKTKIDFAVLINTPRHIIENRITGRRICKCGASYNVSTNLLPKKEGICDDCGSKLIHRDDDKADAFKVRMNSYDKRAEPLIKYYKKSNRLLTVDWPAEELREDDVDIPPQTMINRIVALLKK